MAMPELRNRHVSVDQHFDADRHLTADVTHALKFSACVTPRQQQAAKERLMRRAVQQMPLPVVEERHVLRDYAFTLRHHAVSLMNFLFVDSSAYERARRLPSLYRHYNVHGRYAFTVINMSA